MSGNPQSSQGMGNGVGNMQSLSPWLQQILSGTGGMQSPQSQIAPGFTQPQSSANPTNTMAVNPQLTGGYWNQMTQALAGPQYVAGGTGNAAMSGGAPNGVGGGYVPGRMTTMPIRGGGGINR